MYKYLDKYVLGIEENIEILKEHSSNIKLTSIDDVRNIIVKRKRDSHKGTYGRIGFFSGSKGMAGAAVLNLNAALRSGSGLVKAIVPDSIYHVVESMSIEGMTYTYSEDNLSYEEIDNELLSFADVVAIGSGCKNLKHFSNYFDYIIKKTTIPMVIDAEGINQLFLDKLKNREQPIILTPHFGEMAKLLKKDVSFLRKNIIETARNFSITNNIFLVLKGARTLSACPDGTVLINTTGNPGMATAGSGDVLTGVIASLLGQGIKTEEALLAGVYIHGLAGDIAADKYGEHSLIATDIISNLPKAFKNILI